MPRLTTLVPAILMILFAACTLLAPVAVRVQPAVQDPVTLERIMSDPTWIGRSPETARWVEDGASVWYRRSLPELEGSEWVHIDLEGRELEVVGEERAQALFARGDTTRDGRRSILERGGDLFLLDHETGAERRLTRTEERESGPQFLADEGRIVFRRSSALILRDLADGFESQVAVLELGEEPKEDDPDEPAARSPSTPSTVPRCFRRLPISRSHFFACRTTAA
jgi:Tol biopolymer transport system component